MSEISLHTPWRVGHRACGRVTDCDSGVSRELSVLGVALVRLVIYECREYSLDHSFKESEVARARVGFYEWRVVFLLCAVTCGPQHLSTLNASSRSPLTSYCRRT